MSRVVYGIRSVEELLRRRPGSVQHIWTLDGASSAGLRRLLTRAGELGVGSSETSAEHLSDLCGSSRHQGIVAVAGEYSYVYIDELLSDDALLLVVDSITDPQNLGAMIRSAVALGATGMIITKDRCAQITPAVVRIASGATEYLRCARVTNLGRALDQLKEFGIWTAASLESGGQPPSSVDLKMPWAIVLGSEQRGVRHGVRKRCDVALTINTPGPLKALNVASATAALFYEACRQRAS